MKKPANGPTNEQQSPTFNANVQNPALLNMFQQLYVQHNNATSNTLPSASSSNDDSVHWRLVQDDATGEKRLEPINLKESEPRPTYITYDSELMSQIIKTELIVPKLDLYNDEQQDPQS